MKNQLSIINNKIRIFAGPNGSGKSTIFNLISSKFDLGHYINADQIEALILKDQKIILSDFGVQNISNKVFQHFCSKHSIIEKAKKAGFDIKIILKNDILYFEKLPRYSYEASFVADFIREKLLKLGKKFSYETVMSHNSKINFIKKASKKGYKVYLYYIATETPKINLERVKQRVKMGGHDVKEALIEKRYYESLLNLKEAIKYTYRTFVFDNSGEKSNLILEIFKGREITNLYPEIPVWVDTYIYK